MGRSPCAGRGEAGTVWVSRARGQGGRCTLGARQPHGGFGLVINLSLHQTGSRGTEQEASARGPSPPRGDDKGQKDLRSVYGRTAGWPTVLAGVQASSLGLNSEKEEGSGDRGAGIPQIAPASGKRAHREHPCAAAPPPGPPAHAPCARRLTGFGIHHCFARSMMGHEVKVPLLEDFYADYYAAAGIALASCLAMCLAVRVLGRRGGLLLFMILTALASLLQLGLLNLIGKYSQHPDSGMSDKVKDKFSITFSIVGMFASHAVGSLSVFFCAEITPTVIRTPRLGSPTWGSELASAGDPLEHIPSVWFSGPVGVVRLYCASSPPTRLVVAPALRL
uniref:Uncharacterized protein LOC104983321 n=1 Tax=Bison bison bison TaxID=43346 RepID=A0A6P3GNI0_BISBB|nr:PREDICTED: uncharacterized protein LOC104983321 [Bison bison bison]